MEMKFTKEFEVTVTRKIKIGMVLNINPSDCYLDIEPGKIEVVEIGEIKDINNDSYDYLSFALITDNGEVPKYWVEYQYIDNKNYKEVLPLDVFIEHTMNC